MNNLLKKTHIKANVDLLKARDYYFNFAKRLNLLKTVIVLLPPFALLVTYVFALLNIPSLLNGYGEIIIAALTTVVGFSTYLIDSIIQKNTDISNHLRALYDHKVLGVKYNPYIYRNEDITENIKKAEKVSYSSKYEVWYSEVFSDNHFANVFCCQIDNLLYAKHAYKKAKQFYILAVVLLSALVIASISFSLIQGEYLIAILVAFSVFECYDVFVAKISNLNTALDLCVDFCDYAKGLSPDSLNEDVLEKTQEIINKNRELCIFLPRIIRNKFLEDDNSFYKELNEYKSLFMGEQARIPETANDIDIVYEDGSDTVALKEIQKRLFDMLQRVVQVFEKNGIEYMLDGGTLIGAMRRSTQGFIPWDDDIDITIPANQLDVAKKVLCEQLDYVIQDAENEPFYSTRLSPFKIRERNDQSMISEKDSMLYERYQHKGLFIDVYTFSPILIAKPIDKLFRTMLIHPLNRKLERIENHYHRGSRKSQDKKFFKLKKQHIRLLSFYEKHAKNTRWYAYSPGYIYDLSKAGPYHSSTDLYHGGVNTTLWEGKEHKIPTNPNAVLSAYYGKDWENPPFKSKKELIEKHGKMWYSKAPTKVSALKHIANIIYYNRQTGDDAET